MMKKDYRLQRIPRKEKDIRRRRRRRKDEEKDTRRRRRRRRRRKRIPEKTRKEENTRKKRILEGYLVGHPRIRIMKARQALNIPRTLIYI